MKKSIFSAAMLLLSIFTTMCFTACGSDDDNSIVAKPVISDIEVGSDHDDSNNRKAVRGHDMHLEAAILAEGLTKRIDIEMHQEEGATYEIEKSYTTGKYIGVRNTMFHEHIDIPEDAPLGAYHLHFTVTDQLGQQTTVEVEDIMIVDDDDVVDDDHDHDHDHDNV